MPVAELAGVMRVEKVMAPVVVSKVKVSAPRGAEGDGDVVSAGCDGDLGGGDDAGGGALDGSEGVVGEDSGGGVDGVDVEELGDGVEAEEPLAVGGDGEGGVAFVEQG